MKQGVEARREAARAVGRVLRSGAYSNRLVDSSKLRGPDGAFTWTGSLADHHYGFHWVLYASPITEGGLPVFGHSGSDGTVAIALPEQDALALYFTQSRGTSTVATFVELALELLVL